MDLGFGVSQFGKRRAGNRLNDQGPDKFLIEGQRSKLKAEKKLQLWGIPSLALMMT